MDASELGAGTQLLYVKLAIKRGDWSDLRRHGLDPTPTMKLLFLKGRERYLKWRAQQDEIEAREEALPKFWFELEPGHWVRASSLKKAHAFVESMKTPEVRETEERERRGLEIDTSRTCPHCKLRRIEPGKQVCGNCSSLGYEQ